MKSLSDKFKKEATIEVFEDNEEQTVSRRIYENIYEELRIISFKERKTIYQVLNEVYEFIKPLLLKNGPNILPPVKKTYGIAGTHKSVRISIEFNEFLKEFQKPYKIKIKPLLCSCVMYYINEKNNRL